MDNFLKTEEFLQFCKSAFDHIPIAIDFIDEEGTMIYINPAFSSFLEIPVEDMLNRKINDIDNTSKFVKNLSSKRSDIAVKHRFANGKDAICHRIVILDKFGNLYGGMGMILFDHVSDMKEMIKKYEQLDKKVEMYKREIAKQHRTKYSLADIKGKSRLIENCKREVEKISPLNINVLISGESGVGKELFAHSIHNMSNRSHMPFVTVNCSAVVESLFESEFFGYEGGTFTGADPNGKMGKFELANGGTLFLDEIGDMPFAMQAKLLRVLQEKEILRVGGINPIEIDVRIISATHKDLKKMVEEEKFREDLYYRLNIYNLQIPPLRERIEDIPILVQMMLDEFLHDNGIYRGIDDEALQLLQSSSLNGNVRELKSIILRSCVHTEEVIIQEKDVRQFIRDENEDSQKETQTPAQPGGLFKKEVSKLEREIILQTLQKCQFNKKRAAEILNIPRTTFYRKLKSLNLNDYIE